MRRSSRRCRTRRRPVHPGTALSHENPQFPGLNQLIVEPGRGSTGHAGRNQGRDPNKSGGRNRGDVYGWMVWLTSRNRHRHIIDSDVGGGAEMPHASVGGHSRDVRYAQASLTQLLCKFIRPNELTPGVRAHW